ncbi:Alpha/Beta hydrolase protein [Cladochytrium replicatum]|nr:Alpha/Beta hydrolase protein [Cladochytrium replicatum]
MSSLSGSESPFAVLVNAQSIAELPELVLDSVDVLRNLNDDGWGPLLGAGRAFDPTVYFIFCGNVLGSPYGSASPLTINPVTGKPYGPEFPVASIRDDVRAHKAVLDILGVKQIQYVVGGSMGGMQCLEWAFFGPEYVKNIVPIATSARHSAWGISWGEAQRQAIFSDPDYNDGYYTRDQVHPSQNIIVPNCLYSFLRAPLRGLAAARMTALLTYRSRNSFESRFGRKLMPEGSHKSQQQNSQLSNN